MLILDVLSEDRQASREVILTIEGAASISEGFGVEDLSQLDPKGQRELYASFSKIQETTGPAKQTRLKTTDGSLTLDVDDMSDDMIGRILPERPDGLVEFDPTYSSIGFTVRVMGALLSDRYQKATEPTASDYRSDAFSEMECIIERAQSIATVAFQTLLEPPNLA